MSILNSGYLSLWCAVHCIVFEIIWDEATVFGMMASLCYVRRGTKYLQNVMIATNGSWSLPFLCLDILVGSAPQQE